MANNFTFSSPIYSYQAISTKLLAPPLAEDSLITKLTNNFQVAKIKGHGSVLTLLLISQALDIFDFLPP